LIDSKKTRPANARGRLKEEEKTTVKQGNKPQAGWFCAAAELKSKPKPNRRGYRQNGIILSPKKQKTAPEPIHPVMLPAD